VADSSIAIEESSVVTARMDAERVVVAGQTVQRERVQVRQAVAPVNDFRSSSNLAAGAAVDLDASVIANGATGRLLRVLLASSLPCKWALATRAGAAVVTRAVLFTSGLSGQRPSETWDAPDPELVILAGNGTDTQFRVTATNLDAAHAADVYATIQWDEVA
jgi:hypothetical protein